MGNLTTFTTDEIEQWMNVLKRMYLYDFYHLPCYHQLAEKHGEGQAVLFYFQQDDYHIALPLLVRRISEVPGLEKAGDNLFDATSVYGYAGPVASHASLPGEIIRQFQSELYNELNSRNIISVFSRLHPFIEQSGILEGLGNIVIEGVTVSIDLSLDLDTQRAQYSKGHKSGVNKLRKMGVECIHDTELKYLPEFLELYYETMDRVHANGYYYFPKENFEFLINKLGAKMHLFICLLEGKVICGGLYAECNGILQAYLGGMYSEYRNIAPRKLEKDTVRIWATENNKKIFHLGGGLGGKKDSLYEFKSGFSKNRHDFTLWKWITNKEMYDELTLKRKADMTADAMDDKFFPAYRIR